MRGVTVSLVSYDNINGNRIVTNPAANKREPKMRDKTFSSPETPFHKTIFTKKRAFFLMTRKPVNIIKTPIKMIIMVSILLHPPWKDSNSKMV